MKTETKNRKQFLRLTLGLLVLWTTAAYAADVSVFGLKLGQPLPMPECERSARGDYAEMTRQTCFQSKFRGGRISIKFPYEQKPQIVAEDTIYCIVVDGILEGIQFETLGLSIANRVLTELTNKYGKPLSVQRPIIQNRMGAQFDSVDAVWHLPNLRVFFYGVMHRLDSGMVYIHTLKGDAENRRMETLSRDPKPL